MKSFPPVQTDEELEIVKQYILLPIVLDVLERDISLLQKVPLKMAAIYMLMLRHLQNKTTFDLALVRGNLRKHGIKVYEQQRTKLNVEIHYICRGYHHKFAMLWSLVKSEIEKILSLYLNIDLRR